MAPTRNQYEMQDPTKQYPTPKFDEQPQSAPGLARDMKPSPDHGEASYQGFGRLGGRRAVSPGADRGSGRAGAIGFAREGADRVLTYLPSEEADAQEVMQLVEAAGVRGVAMPGDLCDEAFCTTLIDTARERLGGIDILVNVAGKQTAVTDIAELTTEQFELTFRTNVTAMFWLCKAALPHMPPGATIVNTTSILGYTPNEALLDYSATKAAIVSFTHSLARQVAAKGIRVNAVAPGPFWTPLQPSGGQPQEKIPDFGSMVPLKRPGQPAECAPIYVLLASQESSFVTGEVYGVTGGNHLPLGQYAALGDGRSVALVGADGSIDWWCVPNLDSVPLFDRILDPETGGRFELQPAEPFTVGRAYRPDSNVLEQVFTTASGTARVTDSLNSGISGRLPWSELARRVEGLAGTVEFRIVLLPGRRLGQANPWHEDSSNGVVLHVDGIIAAFRHGDGVTITDRSDGRLVAALTTVAGSRHVVAVLASANEPLILPSMQTIDARIDRSDQAWREWSGNLNYDGPYRAAVTRSALALKLLLFSPTGAIAAAATTSLPERIGGAKNYDYRYAWVRDVSYSIKAFLHVGAVEEAKAAFSWMIATAKRHPGRLRTMYALNGSLAPEQVELDLPGYRGSTPVLQGNMAREQVQLGVFGDIMETAALFVAGGHVLDLVTRRLLAELADRCADVWLNKDAGIWELEQPEHYTFSKIGCWSALDRAASLARAGQIDTSHAERWVRERDRIRDWVDAHCWSEARQSYTLHAGTERLDAAMLLAPRFGFERSDRLALTRDAVQRELGHGPLVYRYSGMQDEEGSFLCCAFWLVEAYALLGEQDRAVRQMDALLQTVSGNLGLLNEQMDPADRAMLGNVPQALSHLALIGAAIAIEEGK